MNSFILSIRNKVINKDSYGIGIGGVSYLKVPDTITVPIPSEQVGLKVWLQEIVKQANPSDANAGEEVDIVFFVHGYNTDCQEALKRQRLVEVELRKRNFNCMVIGFDWPTAGNALMYEYDRTQALDAARFLVKGGILPFANYSVINCPINVHVMAHSMGAFVVREAFRLVDKVRDASLANDWRVGQLVLLGADVSSNCFTPDNPDTQSIFNHCGRLTNYFSRYDEALAVSNVKNIDISSRAGRIGMPSPTNSKAVDVDCSSLYAAIPNRKFTIIEGMISHSWYFEDTVWYDDLATTLKGDIDRNVIPNRTHIGDDKFVLKAGIT